MERAVRGAVRRSMSLATARPLPKEASASRIRKSFLEFFCDDHDHLHVRSSPVFSLKDPTLAFVNAGMNQFKDVFLGLIRPASTRVANSQKCVRVGGKHNDLDQVGLDGSHHTFFEMLGNWSFGDYFKKEACGMSWELLTKVYGIPPERLYVTYFGGDQSLGLEADAEVQEIWRELGVKESHILPFGAKDNFWEGSTTGPCGPCTEIHYDHVPGRLDAGHLVNAGSPDLTEIWNLVFTQYNRNANGALDKLKMRCVDTGMGFERLVAVVQGKTSNYDTDLFAPLFEAIEKYSGHSGYTGKYDGSGIDSSYRVLADHSRMIAVTLSDGMLPNHQNKIRTVIRKALNVSKKVFASDSGLLKELTHHVADILSDAYPEIGKNIDKVKYVILAEEELMNKQRKEATDQWKKIVKQFPALEEVDVADTPQVIQGIEYIKKEILGLEKTVVSGEAAWVLFDSLGVPVHVTEQLASKLNLQFDMYSFESHAKLLKKTNKEVQHSEYLKTRIEGGSAQLDLLRRLEDKNLEPTVDCFKHDYRVDDSGAYVFDKQETTVLAILRGDSLLEEITPEDLNEGEEIGLVLDRTQFFSNEGGQEGDRGILTIENDLVFDVLRVLRVGGFVIHFGIFKNFPRGSKLSTYNLGVLELDGKKRVQTMRNHTALHLLNAAIRNFFWLSGEKSSSVTPDGLSLIFMLYENVSEEEEAKKLEEFVKEFVLHGVAVKRQVFDHQQFWKLDSVVFVPGEPILGAEIPVVEINSGFKLSREYCPGTHVLNTSDLKDFVITNFCKASYRSKLITAVTGEKAAEIRESDARMEEKMSNLSKDVFSSEHLDPLQVKELSLRVTALESELATTDLSYVKKALATKLLKKAKKYLKVMEPASMRNHVEGEVEDLMKNSKEKFEVCSFRTKWPADVKALQRVAEICQEKPAMVLWRFNDSLVIQSCVPEDLVSEDFSAEKWLLYSVSGLGGVGSWRKGENPESRYLMEIKKVTEEQVSGVVAAARAFARGRAGVRGDLCSGGMSGRGAHARSRHATTSRPRP